MTRFDDADLEAEEKKLEEKEKVGVGKLVSLSKAVTFE